MDKKYLKLLPVKLLFENGEELNLTDEHIGYSLLISFPPNNEKDKTGEILCKVKGIDAFGHNFQLLKGLKIIIHRIEDYNNRDTNFEHFKEVVDKLQTNDITELEKIKLIAKLAEDFPKIGILAAKRMESGVDITEFLKENLDIINDIYSDFSKGEINEEDMLKTLEKFNKIRKDEKNGKKVN
jgi:glutamyl/glutaminyl-tRNA synthetase